VGTALLTRRCKREVRAPADSSRKRSCSTNAAGSSCSDSTHTVRFANSRLGGSSSWTLHKRPPIWDACLDALDAARSQATVCSGFPSAPRPFPVRPEAQPAGLLEIGGTHFMWRETRDSSRGGGRRPPPESVLNNPIGHTVSGQPCWPSIQLVPDSSDSDGTWIADTIDGAAPRN